MFEGRKGTHVENTCFPLKNQSWKDKILVIYVKLKLNKYINKIYNEYDAN